MRAAVPSARSSHPLALSSGSTNAEEERAPAPARQKAKTGVVRMGRTWTVKGSGIGDSRTMSCHWGLRRLGRASRMRGAAQALSRAS